MAYRTTLEQQRGMTAIGWLVVLALIGFFVLLILRIGPVYMNYYKVAASVDSLGEEALLAEKTRREVRNLLFKRFDINEISQVTPEDVVVTKDGGTVDVEVKYEHRVDIIGNVDVIVSFHKTATVR